MRRLHHRRGAEPCRRASLCNSTPAPGDDPAVQPELRLHVRPGMLDRAPCTPRPAGGLRIFHDVRSSQPASARQRGAASCAASMAILAAPSGHGGGGCAHAVRCLGATSCAAPACIALRGGPSPAHEGSRRRRWPAFMSMPVTAPSSSALDSRYPAADGSHATCRRSADRLSLGTRVPSPAAQRHRPDLPEPGACRLKDADGARERTRSSCPRRLNFGRPPQPPETSLPRIRLSLRHLLQARRQPAEPDEGLVEP